MITWIDVFNFIMLLVAAFIVGYAAYVIFIER